MATKKSISSLEESGMKRVLVVGNLATGKSTVTCKIAARLNLPAYHLDSHFWKPGWNMPDKGEWSAWVNRAVLKEEWILDGNYPSSLLHRASRADTLVFIELPCYVSLYRYLRRTASRSRSGQADIPYGADESIRLRNIRAIFRFSQDVHPKILEAAALVPSVLVFKSTEAAMDWAVQLAPDDELRP